MQIEKIAPSYPVDNPVDNSPGDGYYLDTYAKVSKPKENNDLEQKNLGANIAKYLFWSGHLKEANRLTNCGQNWIPFSCERGHKIYHQVACGLPYCPKCSKKGSWFNKKRAQRVQGFLLGFPALGHLVFTIPKELSLALPGPDKINKLYKLAWKVLSEVLDAEAAIIILHFCGDKAAGLHLHFDCSFPLLHREPDFNCAYPLGLLELVRAEWTAGVNKVFSKAYLDTVSHYNFINTIEQEHHLISYITRSTITAEKFVELPEAQKEYCLKMSKKKLIRYFGAFVGKRKEEFLKQYRCQKMIDENKPEGLIEQHICPICREKMRAGRLVFMDDINLSQVERYNNYTLVDRVIGAFIRGEEQTRKKESPGQYGSLLEYLKAQEKSGGE